MVEIPSIPGTYSIVLSLNRNLHMATSSREFGLRKGTYVYIGSARGPGGLKARLSRHLAKKKDGRWHIDYLTSSPHCRIMALVSCASNRRLEVKLCKMFSKDQRYNAIRGFGSSDDFENASHLFLFRSDVRGCIASTISKHKSLRGSGAMIFVARWL